VIFVLSFEILGELALITGGLDRYHRTNSDHIVAMFSPHPQVIFLPTLLTLVPPFFKLTTDSWLTVLSSYIVFKYYLANMKSSPQKTYVLKAWSPGRSNHLEVIGSQQL
jgi:hypothetical protein